MKKYYIKQKTGFQHGIKFIKGDILLEKLNLQLDVEENKENGLVKKEKEKHFI